MIDLNNPDERAAAAGEHVLGTLSAEDEQQFSEALPRDAALRAEVAHWQDRLLALTARTPAQQPGPGLWPRIEASLDRLRGSAAAGASAAAERRTDARRREPIREPWWQRLGLWQGLSGLAVAAALVLAVVLLQPGLRGDAPVDRYVAMLQSPDGQSTGWVVEVVAGDRVRLVPVAAPEAIPPGRTWQFWTKAEGAAGPTSLGLVSGRRTLELPVSALPAVGERQLFEITLEPEGGSPIDRPTGPILFVGRSVKL